MTPGRPGWKTLLLVSYGLLLALSHAVRMLEPAVEAGPGESRVLLEAVDGEHRVGRAVPVDYLAREPRDRPDAPTVLLLTGSPGRKEDFGAVLPVLAARYRVVVPDLPGFGKSRSRVPDYSIRAHAHYVLQLMQALEVPDAHVVGFSMGGGVALNLYDLAPERVRSVTLLSSIGVQELELFGDHGLNHLVHGAQLAALWLAQEGLPHMGALDRFPLNVPYARNFFDTDQRPLRDVLGRLEPPVLVIHGRRDFLVPPEAAVEHHRIVPHSELQMLDASHFAVFVRGDDIGRRIREFITRVDDGLAARRDEATSERIAAAEAPFDPRTVPPATGVGLFVLMGLIAVATLVSEDLTCISVGLLAGQGRIEFLPGVVACFAGIFVGDLLLFLAGRYLGRPVLRHGPLSWWLTEEQVDAASCWFSTRGPIVIGLSRFLPGARLPTYFAAGTLKTSFWAFAWYFSVAVAIWTPLLVWLSMLLGARTLDYFEIFRRHSLIAALVLALWILLVVRFVLPLATFRGRRRLVGLWRRIRNSEFWPPWVFYPPVVANVVWLGLRHRSPLLFTAANPAMPAGGFISESKGETLRALAASEPFVAQSRLLPSRHETARRIRDCEAFMADRGLDLPLVLKPDAGQRGSGVVVARTPDKLRAYFERAAFDVLAQEYVPGREFGIFYCRYPDEERGFVFSVTEKRIPEIRGDGRHTVEQLILMDRRAVCMAALYLSRHQDRLAQVLAAGQSLPLVELGTHCRGAVFVDGAWVLTDALEEAIDRISRAYDGFYFGRYDIRTESVDDFRQGRNFKVIELNGVTSEATHIYDPGIRLLGAYRILFEQWRIAFEIGRQNRRRGVRPASAAMLLRLVRQYRRTSRTHPP